jgi:hypothetical protein
MLNLTKEYLLLFNTITDVEDSLQKLRETLIAAQQQAEELVLAAQDHDDSSPIGA